MSFAEDMGHDIPPMWGEDGFDFGYSNAWGRSEEWVTTEDVTIEHETDKAYLVKDNSTDSKFWLPKSQVKFNEETKQFDIPKWLSDKLEPIDEE